MSEQTEPDGVVAVRPAEPSDMNFVFATWLREMRHADGSPLPDDIWFPAYRELVNRVLADPAVSVLIVHPTDARNEILGYIVAQPQEVLWQIYVKPKFRKHGLAKMLLRAAQAETAVAAWSTADAKLVLKNLRRPRQLRPLYAAKSKSGPSPF